MYIRAPQYLKNVDSPYEAKFVRPGVKLSEFLRGNLQILLSTLVRTERGADDRVLTQEQNSWLEHNILRISCLPNVRITRIRRCIVDY